MADGSPSGVSGVELAAARVGAVMAERPRDRFRSPHARASSMAWRSWVEATADALRDVHRAPDLASELRACGRDCWVMDCSACEESFARVEVRASCDVRVCPWCARRRSAARVEAIGGAISRLPEVIQSQRLQADADARSRASEALEARDHWREVARRAGERRASRVAYWSLRASSERATSVSRDRARVLASKAEREETAVIRRAERSAAKAEHRYRTARREIQAIREASSLRLDGGVRLGRWRWRLVTIGEPWRPSDPREVDAAGLRRRIDAVLRRWSRCWAEGAKAGGLAAAYASVECSANGHVHVHVLYLGPWIDVRWWTRVAGVKVDVREVDYVPGVERAQPSQAALMEAVKYALKSPSPWAREWLSGKARKVAHPRLAAAWVIATRHHQIARAFGTLRATMDCESGLDDGDVETDKAEDSAERDRRCCFCGTELRSYPVPWKTAKVAEVLGSKWSLSGRRDPLLGPMPPRVAIPRA